MSTAQRAGVGKLARHRMTSTAYEPRCHMPTPEQKQTLLLLLPWLRAQHEQRGLLDKISMQQAPRLLILRSR